MMAHMGHPWCNGCIVVAHKQPNVYCEISALYYRPWQFYDMLVSAQEYTIRNRNKSFWVPTFPMQASRNLWTACVRSTTSSKAPLCRASAKRRSVASCIRIPSRIGGMGDCRSKQGSTADQPVPRRRARIIRELSTWDPARICSIRYEHRSAARGVDSCRRAADRNAIGN
jgi:hypothetical protein